MLPPVPELLPFAVTSHGVGVFGSVALPVIRMAGPPLLLAIAADVAVFGIAGDLLPVVVGAAPTLANGFTADRLKRLKLGRLKRLLTVAAAPFPHNRRCRTVSRLPKWSRFQNPKRVALFLAEIGSNGRRGSFRNATARRRFRNCCRVHTASPPMSSLRTTTKPGKLRVF